MMCLVFLYKFQYKFRKNFYNEKAENDIVPERVDKKLLNSFCNIFTTYLYCLLFIIYKYKIFFMNR